MNKNILAFADTDTKERKFHYYKDSIDMNIINIDKKLYLTSFFGKKFLNTFIQFMVHNGSNNECIC